MNILILSCGTRNKLVRFFRESLSARPAGGRVIAVDCSPWAPALYEADRHYLVPKMTEPGYLERILEICKREEVKGLLPLFEDELELVSQNRKRFEDEEITVLVSQQETVSLCRDKESFYRHLLQHRLPALSTCVGLEEFEAAQREGRMDFPVFVKPVRGCGSAGAFRVDHKEMLRAVCAGPEKMLIQEYARGEEFGADVYVDLISHKPAAIFLKKKVRMRAGETEKAISVKDPALFDLVKRTVATLRLAGPVDMDLFRVGNEFFVSEINPRFGGGYPHAYHCNVNFPEMILNNLEGTENPPAIGAYEEGICMMKYTDEIVRRL